VKTTILTVITLLSFSGSFAVAAHDQGGGGDLCEDRIKIVRDDIAKWIHDGGPEALVLPAGITLKEYSSSMLSQIDVAQIRCVGAGDVGYPVNVGQTPKACRFDRSPDLSQITCDYAKFSLISESDQYVLIHHELAGLAGIEIPKGPDSNYDVSNQISGYLQDTTVKKLVVRPNQPAQPGYSCEADCAKTSDENSWTVYACGGRSDQERCENAGGKFNIVENGYCKCFLTETSSFKIKAHGLTEWLARNNLRKQCEDLSGGTLSKVVYSQSNARCLPKK
jgi:hypothetical protein